MATLRQTPAPSEDVAPVNGLKFFHIIETALSDNKLVKIAFSTAMVYGLWRVYWDIAQPLTEQMFEEAFDNIKDIVITPHYDTEPGVKPGEQ